ncbi:hypothetical protein [Streptomyces sp. NPDC001530]|uniref:hypothetical protein n=1 Tax=Streptomyces sp. NPDC001530 TaxID=3364582 RepID=UPI003682164C
MTLSAALPGAAVRVLRTAAGRRALQVVLLVGGLFALGFLCGEQAHAADGAVPTVPTAAVQSAKGAVDRVVAAGTSASEAASDASPSSSDTPVTGAVPQGTDAVPHVTDAFPHVTGAVPHVADSVTHVTDTVSQVAQPVGGLVEPAADSAEAVVGPIGDAVKTVTGGLTATPPDVLPSVPGLPDRPGDLPGLPTLPGVGAQTPPVTAAPQPSDGVTEQPSATIGHDTGRRSGAPAHPSYGPSGPAVGTGGVDVRRDHHGVRAGQVPAHQAPGGDPTGALGNQSAVDNGAPRHGDPYAVTPNHRAPLRLVPGASAVVTAAETRDRYRDIPVFPG